MSRTHWSLFNYLIQHPNVLSPLGKEIHYFDIHYARGVQWYRGRFPYARQLRNGDLRSGGQAMNEDDSVIARAQRARSNPAAS